MRRDDCDAWERTNPSVPDAATRESNVMAFTKSGVLLGDEIMVLMIIINQLFRPSRVFYNESGSPDSNICLLSRSPLLYRIVVTE